MVAVNNLQSRKLSKPEIKSIMRRVLSSKGLSDVGLVVVLQEVFLRTDLAADLKSGYFVNFFQYAQDLLNIEVPLFLRIAQNSCTMHAYISELSKL